MGLVDGRRVRKTGVELMLPVIIGIKGDPHFGRPGGLHFQQLARHVGDRTFGALASIGPTLAADLGQLGAAAATADVPLDQTDSRRWHINDRSAVELDRQVFLLLAILFDMPQTAIKSDAVRQVDHQIARFKLGDGIDRFAARPRPAATNRAAMKQFRAGQHQHFAAGEPEPTAQVGDDQVQPSAASGIGVGHQFRQPLAIGRSVTDDKNVVVGGDRIDPLASLIDRPSERLDRRCPQVDPLVASRFAEGCCGGDAKVRKGLN